MAAATTLEEAAGQSFTDLFALWESGADALKTAVTAFDTVLLPDFPDDDVVGRPISSWLILIASLAARMPTGTEPGAIVVPYGQLVTAADYVYRICWLGAKATPTSPNITTAQQTALLAAYNANFTTP